jgi:hypothetical protein
MGHQERINIRSPAGAAAVYKDVAQLDSVQEEIRMLHLECGSGSSLPQCTLHRVSLRSDPPPKYEALSYTWGDENDRREIAVNGYIVDVTVNLYSALRRLRLENETRVLWIDALCINQTDLDERSQQVQLMRNIYTLCDRTVIWVGETPEDLSPTWGMHWYGDEKDDKAMDWFWDDFYPEADLSEADANDVDWIFHAFANIRLFSGGHLSDQPLFTDLTGDEFSYSMSYPDYCCQVADALAPFYESPWWTRIWVSFFNYPLIFVGLMLTSECRLSKKLFFLQRQHFSMAQSQSTCPSSLMHSLPLPATCLSHVVQRCFQAATSASGNACENWEVL